MVIFINLIVIVLNVLNKYLSVIRFETSITTMISTLTYETEFSGSVCDGLSFISLIPVLSIINLNTFASISLNTETLILKLDAYHGKSMIMIEFGSNSNTIYYTKCTNKKTSSTRACGAAATIISQVLSIIYLSVDLVRVGLNFITILIKIYGFSCLIDIFAELYLFYGATPMIYYVCIVFRLFCKSFSF